jgi:TetR/AcrR family transcriptional regulator
MPTKKPKVRGRVTRERILIEGARAFTRRGYHGTTLDEIARRLGVTKPALYYYVRTKEALAYECHRISLDIGMEGIRQALARSASPDEQLRIALMHYLAGMTDQLRGTVVLLEEGTLSPRHRRDIIKRRDRYEGKLRQIIEAGIASGTFVPCDPKLAGFAILGAMNWVPKWYNPSGPRSGKEIAEALSIYLVRGLQTRPADSTIPPVPDV